VNGTTHEYRGYVFTLQDTPEGDAIAVHFVDIPNIITSGASLAVAFGNACEALDLYLESLQELGLTIPQPRHRLVVVEQP